MSKAQRDKGARFEREVANLLGAKRHLRCDYSESAPDMTTERWVVECKRRASIAAVRFLEQAIGYAEQDAQGRIPVVMMREDRGPIVAMLLAEDLLVLDLAKEAELRRNL